MRTEAEHSPYPSDSKRIPKSLAAPRSIIITTRFRWRAKGAISEVKGEFRFCWCDHCMGGGRFYMIDGRVRTKSVVSSHTPPVRQKKKTDGGGQP